MIIQERLERLQSVPLAAGGHRSLDEGACVMEMVAFVAGEPWSDQPACACPVIGAFLRAWNDGLPDADRDRLLRPLIPRLVGTKSTPEVEQRRADLALDWFVRVQAPAWLDLTEALSVHAATIRALPPVTSPEALAMATPVLRAAAADASAARDAAWAAARAAAWDAAWEAARDAAWDAAWDAARDAAWDAARDAAWDAARDAAWDAVKDKVGSGDTYGDAYAAASQACTALFAPVRDTLQRSALELIDAMVAITPE